MESNIILLQPWPLVKLQVLNVFDYLECEDKKWVWSEHPQVNGCSLQTNEIIKMGYWTSHLAKKGLTAKAALAMQMFRDNTCLSHTSGGLGPATSMWQMHEGQLRSSCFQPWQAEAGE